jgi:hypothetical protein
MKLYFTASWRLPRLFLLGNAVFWLIFGTNFALKSYAYTQHTKVFEEESSPYILWSRAFPFNEYMSPLMRATRVVQWPSFYAATPVNLYFSHRGIVVDQLYWGISVGGYYLICVCLLSFLQWYLVGLFLVYLRARLRSEPHRRVAHP